MDKSQQTPNSSHYYWDAADLANCLSARTSLLPPETCRWWCRHLLFKLRLGALIPRSVCLSVGLSVCPPKITKKLQNFTKHYKSVQTFKNIEVRSFPPNPFVKKDRQGSFGSMPELP